MLLKNKPLLTVKTIRNNLRGKALSFFVLQQMVQLPPVLKMANNVSDYDKLPSRRT
jgi:hypothetical protein